MINLSHPNLNGSRGHSDVYQRCNEKKIIKAKQTEQNINLKKKKKWATFQFLLLHVFPFPFLSLSLLCSFTFFSSFFFVSILSSPGSHAGHTYRWINPRPVFFAPSHQLFIRHSNIFYPFSFFFLSQCYKPSFFLVFSLHHLFPPFLLLTLSFFLHFFYYILSFFFSLYWLNSHFFFSVSFL